MRRTPMVLVLVVSGLGPGTAVGQVDLSGEAQLISRYVWRGMTRHQDLALLPIASVGWRWLTLTGRVVALDDPCGLRAGGCAGGGGFRIGDRDLVLTAAVPVAGKLVTAGLAQRSIATAPWLLTPTRVATTEVSLSIGAAPSRGIQWALTGWYDLGPIDGAYAELAATTPVAIPQGGVPNLFITGGLGLSAGQAVGTDPVGYFADDGITHAWLEVAVVFAKASEDRRLGWNLFARVQGNFDAATRRASLLQDRERPQRIWLGVSTRGVARVGGRR